MKKNYTLKTIKTGLAIFALTLSSAFVSAQVAKDTIVSARTLAAGTTYESGAINLITADLNHEGVSFKIQFTVTPNSTANGADANIASNNNNRWGVDDDRFDGELGESAVLSGLTIIDFNDNGTGYTSDAISNLHFNGIQIFAASNRAEDNPTIQVDGANSGTFEIGQTTDNSTIITFGTEYFNQAAVDAGTINAGEGITVGSAGDVSTITLSTGSGTPTFRNEWFIISTYMKYTFTTNPALSVEDNIKKDALSIFPTIVENSFSVSKEFETLTLFDITGKTVKRYTNTDALEVSGLDSGLYLVKLKSETGAISTGKLIVK